MKSVIQNKEDRQCYICKNFLGDFSEKSDLEEHHIFGGPNRTLSEKFGLKVYLCHEHHQNSPESVHNNKDPQYNLLLKQEGQKAFMKQYPDKDFVKVFGKSYL